MLPIPNNGDIGLLISGLKKRNIYIKIKLKNFLFIYIFGYIVCFTYPSLLSSAFIVISCTFRIACSDNLWASNFKSSLDIS